MSVRSYHRGSILWALCLIVVGGLFLWRNFNPNLHPWQILAKYWPVLIIFWGISKLIDYVEAQAHPETKAPPLFSGGEVILLILILVMGTLISNIVLRPRSWGWNIDSDEITGLFMNSYTFDQTFSAPVPSGSQLVLEEEHGAVQIQGADQSAIDVTTHKIIRADDENDARKLADGLKYELVEEGGQRVLRSNRHSLLGNDRITSVDLDLRVPRATSSEVSSERGDIQVEGLRGDQTLSARHGDVRATNIEGSVKIHKSGGSTEARDVKGNLELDGRGGDVEVDGVTGTVTVNGEFDGAVEFRNLAQTLHYRSNRTEMTAQKLSGRLHMEVGSLEVDGVDGPLDVTTRQKDITVKDFKQTLRITDSSGQVTLKTDTPPAHDIEVESKNGGIDLQLPPGANFQIQATSRHGEVQCDFTGPGLKVVDTGESPSITGTIGKGGPMIRLSTDYGAIRILHAGSTKSIPASNARPVTYGSRGHTGRAVTGWVRHYPAVARSSASKKSGNEISTQELFLMTVVPSATKPAMANAMAMR